MTNYKQPKRSTKRKSLCCLNRCKHTQTAFVFSKHNYSPTHSWTKSQHNKPFYSAQGLARHTYLPCVEFPFTMMQRIRDKLDLTKKYPNYFGRHTKILVRGVFAIILLYLLYLGMTYGWETNLAISCPEYSERCFNEYYYEGCTEDYCSTQYLLGGETRGKPFPADAFNKFWWLLGSGFFFIVACNHYVYIINKHKGEQ